MFLRSITPRDPPDIDFPGAPFLVGPGDIVGASAVASGRRRTAPGIVARGNTLVLRLDRANPAFANVLAYPFFQATPKRLPLDEVSFAERGLASAGPYHVVASDQQAGTMTLRPKKSSPSLLASPEWSPMRTRTGGPSASSS